MTATSPADGRLHGLRTGCARALDRAAALIDDPPSADPGPVLHEAPPSTAFAYDADLPPDVPPGESLDDWRHERALRRHEETAPRHRLAARVRRAARRLDGRVIDTHTLPLG